jgi:hypothetical protein
VTEPSAPRPKVSVVTITYNQASFIAEALDSFVAQQTDFPVEFIVADDASTDGTTEIVAAYAERHPGLFRPILRPTNVGIGRNLVDALTQARGDYLALCEGDDYWIDPQKLARQVAHLDANPRTAVCFHPVQIVRDDGQPKGREFPRLAWRDDFSLERLLERNFIQTNSVMYRSLPPTDYSRVPVDILPLDYYLHLLHARTGAIAFLPEPMAAYRHHENGVWSDPKSGNLTRFWANHGPSILRGRQALLDLFRDDPDRQALVLRLVAKTFATMALEAGAEPGSPLAAAIQNHPQLATLAIEGLAREAAEGQAERKRTLRELHDLRAVAARRQARIKRLKAKLDNAASPSGKTSLVGRLRKPKR